MLFMKIIDATLKEDYKNVYKLATTQTLHWPWDNLTLILLTNKQ